MPGSVTSLRRLIGLGKAGAMARQRQAVRVRQDQSFKGRQFTAEVILWAVQWYLMFPISYRDLELMLLDCGVEVDHTTIFTPQLTQAVRGLHGFGLSNLAGQASVARTITGQAYLLAANDIFWASGWICLIMIGMVWLCRRSVSGGGAPVAAD